MSTKLPPRPNLDHLRRQAKSLLAQLEDGDAGAAATLQEHLPAAQGMTAHQVRSARFRLADAQSAIARKSGFASWPQLSRHVEQLRALEGSWAFASLEVGGNPIPTSSMQSSRILIDGDRFRTESPEAIYEGVFNIDVEASPHHIDIEFVDGPEAGNTNHGIFRLHDDSLEICLDMNGKARPGEFVTKPRSGHAYERLVRLSTARPDSVTGGTPRVQTGTASTGVASPPAEFALIESAILKQLQGEWSAESIVRDGVELPAMLIKSGRRTMKGNEAQIHVAGQLIIHALVRIDEKTRPMHIDYFNLAGPSMGMIQRGIMEMHDTSAFFCMAAPEQPRPETFTCAAGSGRTLSRWKPNVTPKRAHP